MRGFEPEMVEGGAIALWASDLIEGPYANRDIARAPQARVTRDQVKTVSQCGGTFGLALISESCSVPCGVFIWKPTTIDVVIPVTGLASYCGVSVAKDQLGAIALWFRSLASEVFNANNFAYAAIGWEDALGDFVPRKPAQGREELTPLIVTLGYTAA